MTFLITFVLIVVLGHFFGSILAWWDYHNNTGAPFNWRIWLGPKVYMDWEIRNR